MFTGEANKAWVAAIMALLVIAEQLWGVHLGVSEELVTSILVAVGALLVWLVPNTSS